MLRSGTLFVAGLTAMVLSACGAGPQEAGEAVDPGDLDALVAAAKEEGSLTFYPNTQDSQNEAAAQAFEEKYGITVNAIPRQGSGFLIQRLESELAAGGSPADVLVLSNTIYFDEAESADTFVKLDEEVIPASSTLDDKFELPNAAAVSITNYGVCYNSDVVGEDDLTTYDDFLSPDLTPIEVQSEASLPNLAAWRVVQNAQGEEFLRQFGERQPRKVETAASAIELVISGSGDFVFPCFESAAALAKADGAPVDFKRLPPTAYGAEFYGAVLQKAPHPNAGRLFLNFLLTEEGQAAYNSGAGTSPLGDVPGALELPDEYQVHTVDFLNETTQMRDQILNELDPS